MENNFISTDTMFFLMMLLDRMPNLMVAVYKYAALEPLPKEQIQRVISLTEQHFQESCSHYNLIVPYALYTIVVIRTLDMIILKKMRLITNLQKDIEDQLFDPRSKYIELKTMAELTQKDNQQQQNEINSFIQKIERQLALVTRQERELIELRNKIDNLFKATDEVVAYHEARWQSRQQEASSNLVKQLKILHNIALTQEDLANLQDDAPRSVAAKKDALEKNKIWFTKEAAVYEILVHYIIWQWLSRSLKSIKEEPQIFKSLIPYLKQEIDLREQLQKEVKQKHTAIRDEVNNLQKIVDKFDIEDRNSLGG